MFRGCWGYHLGLFSEPGSTKKTAAQIQPSLLSRNQLQEFLQERGQTKQTILFSGPPPDARKVPAAFTPTVSLLDPLFWCFATWHPKSGVASSVDDALKNQQVSHWSRFPSTCQLCDFENGQRVVSFMKNATTIALKVTPK